MFTPSDPAPALDPQVQDALLLLRFRSGMTTAEDHETVTRAARVLRAPADAPLIHRVLGLPDGDPDAAADFGDVTAMLDDWAEQIHTPPRYDAGRHERTA